MALVLKIAATMRFMKVLANCRILVFSNMLKMVSRCVADISNLHRTDHIQNDKQRIVD